MRILIDGYNLMFAGGLLGQRLGRDGLRKVRQRFLNDLADALGPIDAHQTTVVFDAARAVGDLPDSVLHKGLSVVFAVDTDDADERIEQLIAGHSHPRALTVVSSDRRLRKAATRRRSRAVTAEDFWAELDARKERRARTPSPPPPQDEPRPTELSPEESAHWLREFAELDHDPATQEALAPDDVMLTDEEIDRLQREVDGEFR
jgi:uncharacterized protein